MRLVALAPPAPAAGPEKPLETTYFCRNPAVVLDPLQLGQRVLEAIETLGAGEILEILTDREPLLLRNEVAQRGVRLSSKADRGGFVTTIRRNGTRTRPAMS